MPRLWPRRAADGIPEAARRAVGEVRGDRVIAWGTDERTGNAVAAGRTHLYVATVDGEVVLDVPWHLVETGRWDHDEMVLVVGFVDHRPDARWALGDDSRLTVAFRERVQASVVLSEAVELGSRRSARVVVRRNLATGDLLGQTILGRGVRRSDPGVEERTSAALARLKEQAGL
jgi:hypothetical protein